MVKEIINMIDNSKDSIGDLSLEEKKDLYRKIERKRIEDEVLHCNWFNKIVVKNGRLMSKARLFFLIPFSLLLILLLSYVVSSLVMTQPIIGNLIVPVFILYLLNTYVFVIAASRRFVRRFLDVDDYIVNNLGRNLKEEKRQIEEELEQDIFVDL